MGWPISSCTGIQIAQSVLEHLGQGHSVVHYVGQDPLLSLSLSRLTQVLKWVLMDS